QHARRGLADARGGVAEPGRGRDPLGDQATDRGEVGQVLELLAVAERSRRGQDGIPERDATGGDGQLDRRGGAHAPLTVGKQGSAGRGGSPLPTSSTSAASNTGPLLQT